MLDERSSFTQKLCEPRVLGWIAVALVLILWEAIVAIAHLNPILLAAPNTDPYCACKHVERAWSAE